MISMAFKIGFAAEHPAEKQNEAAYITQKAQTVPRKSVVQVRFPGRGMALAYYNDLFDLKCGDMVYVEGFGWLEYQGPNHCEYGADIYENGNKIGIMG